MKYGIRPIAFVLIFLVSGCSLRDIRSQADLIESRASIHGRVEVKSVQKGPVQVYLYQIHEGYIELVNKKPVFGNHQYHFYALPGSYIVGMFVDANQDGEYQPAEHATYLGADMLNPVIIVLEEREQVEVETAVITGPLKTDFGDVKIRNALNKAEENIGRIVSLNNPMFLRENATLGLWQPVDFIKLHGGGLMMLQAFEEDKIPVIFVHGILGTGLDFKELIDELDKEHFQPWILYYPSGTRLDFVSDYFLKALNQLYVRHEFSRVGIVAHSMGGLIARSFVMKHQANEPPYQITFVVTISSPFHGLESAGRSLTASPIVIPVWRDLARGSDFLRKIHAWDWPEHIPYYLVFSFLQDKADDGVVPLKSQLSLSLQDEATRLYGFQAQHAGLLENPEFIARFNQVLSNYE